MSSDSDTVSKELRSSYECINQKEIKEQSKPAKVTKIETVAASNSFKSFNIQDQTTVIAPLIEVQLLILISSIHNKLNT